eukprot:COSAG06_NODE_4_length_41837_cov_204.557597_29_plen_77_part_00
MVAAAAVAAAAAAFAGEADAVHAQVDTPSHTECWCRGYPNICPPKHCGIRTPLDPSKNETFEMVQGIFEELTPLFP